MYMVCVHVHCHQLLILLIILSILFSIMFSFTDSSLLNNAFDVILSYSKVSTSIYFLLPANCNSSPRSFLDPRYVFPLYLSTWMSLSASKIQHFLTQPLRNMIWKYQKMQYFNSSKPRFKSHPYYSIAV